MKSALLVSGTVAKVFESVELPTWIWLFYIPQLLVGLTRVDAKVVKPLLMRIATQHPQALNYYLRVYVLSSKEKARSVVSQYVSDKKRLMEHQQQGVAEGVDPTAAGAQAQGEDPLPDSGYMHWIC